MLLRMDAETAHGIALKLMRLGVVPRVYAPEADAAILATNVWGQNLSNPLGIAAGFDKNGEVPKQLLALGFGFAEVGGVTLRPQPGNLRPRLFRLSDDRAVINRMGFNNAGVDELAGRLEGYTLRRGPVGVNIGLNKDSQTPPHDYAEVTRRITPYADFLVANVSSPNTPGLRALQDVGPLQKIVVAMRAARDESPGGRPPLLLKVSPDLADDDITEITELALAEGVDGLVISNTMVSRPAGLVSDRRTETGGLSGRPLFDLSTRLLARVYKASGGTLPLIGVGGVASGSDAYAKIRAGASLVQLYTALVYAGPALIQHIKTDLAALLRQDGYDSVDAAVGAAHRTG